MSDLKVLIALFKKYHFESEIELFRLENMVGKRTEEIVYSYDTGDVVFNVTTSGMDVNPVVKRISVTLNAKYTLTEVLTNTVDIFKDYSFNIYIKGFMEESDSPQEYSNSFSWHLDREINTDGNYSHPYYHFHAGGHYLNGKNIGELLMISSPRIPHPPMDIFMAIHFIIINFFNSKDFPNQKKILTDDEYVSIIERAQKRVLDPYFSTISGTSHKSYSKHNLFPLYV